MNREESRTEVNEDLPEIPMAPEQERAVRATSGCRRASVSVGNPWVPPMRSGASGAAMRRFYKVGGSLVALMLLLPVTAGAHGPVAFGTPNVIHACKALVGILRQITSGSCVSPEAVVHWNITGPAGATGLLAACRS